MTESSTPLINATPMRRLGLALVVMFLGGSGLVYEYCISTLATHLLGNSIQQFSVIIALMLFAMGIAGLCQKWLTDNPKHLAFTFVLVEIILAVIGGTSAITLYLSFAWLDHFHLVLYALALAIGFGIGLEIPLLLRINQAWRSKLSENVSDVFSLDYVGALFGALVWAFLLLPTMPLDSISLILGLANLGAAALTWFILGPMITRKVLLGTLFALAVAILTLVTYYAPSWKTTARQELFAYPIQHTVHSPYQEIVFTGRGPRLSMYLNGRLQFDSEDEYIYHEMLVHPAMMAATDPKRVLVLGGGDGLAVREILDWPGVEEVLLVDLDPAVTEQAMNYPPLVQLNQNALNDPRVSSQTAPGTEGGQQDVFMYAEEPRDAFKQRKEKIATVTVRNADADLYLRDVPGLWDVIVADFPDPSTPDLAKLYSAEFYAMVKQHLKEDGVFVLQAGSPYHSRSAYWAVQHTVRSVGFETRSIHAHVPTFGEWGWHVAQIGKIPAFTRDIPAGQLYISREVLDAAEVFPKPFQMRPSDQQVSTRVDPWVMRLYQRGEPLAGPLLFPGQAER